MIEGDGGVEKEEEGDKAEEKGSLGGQERGMGEGGGGW